MSAIVGSGGGGSLNERKKKREERRPCMAKAQHFGQGPVHRTWSQMGLASAIPITPTIMHHHPSPYYCGSDDRRQTRLSLPLAPIDYTPLPEWSYGPFPRRAHTQVNYLSARFSLLDPPRLVPRAVVNTFFFVKHFALLDSPKWGCRP